MPNKNPQGDNQQNQTPTRKGEEGKVNKNPETGNRTDHGGSGVSDGDRKR